MVSSDGRVRDKRGFRVQDSESGWARPAGASWGGVTASQRIAGLPEVAAKATTECK